MRNASSALPTELPHTHDVGISDHLYHGLAFVMRAENKRRAETGQKPVTIRQLAGQAVIMFLKSRGAYVHPGGMLDRCPLCERDLSVGTVSKYLYAKNVWICSSCHKTINREFELWKESQRAVRRHEREGTIKR